MAAARRRTRPWNMPLDPNMPEHAHGSLTPMATDDWLAAARRRIMFMEMPVAEQAHISRVKLRLKRSAYGDGKLAAAWVAKVFGPKRQRREEGKRREEKKHWQRN